MAPQTRLEREIFKVAFQRDISLDAATRIVFFDWSKRMQEKGKVDDAYEFVFVDGSGESQA